MSPDKRVRLQKSIPTTYIEVTAKETPSTRRLAAVGKFGPSLSEITHDSHLGKAEDNTMSAAVARAAAFRAKTIASLVDIQSQVPKMQPAKQPSKAKRLTNRLFGKK